MLLFFLTRSDWKSGYTLYYYDLTNCASEDINFSTALKRGNLQLSVNFDKATEKTCNLLMYANFPSLFKIDKTRNVLF